MVLVCVLQCMLRVCVGSRVLVVFPIPSRSHTVLGDSIVKILLGAGHEVTLQTDILINLVPKTAKFCTYIECFM